jgi:hypothetical protein
MAPGTGGHRWGRNTGSERNIGSERNTGSERMPGAAVRTCTHSFAHRAKAAPRENLSASPASSRRCMRSSKLGTVHASDGEGTCGEGVGTGEAGMSREAAMSRELASLVSVGGGTSREPASSLLVLLVLLVFLVFGEGGMSCEAASSSLSRSARCRGAVCERAHAGERRGAGKICALPCTPLGAAGAGLPCISA